MKNYTCSQGGAVMIERAVKSRLCSGCGTCAGICPTKALTMRYSYKNRTYTPSLNKSLCNRCTLCEKVCPGIAIQNASNDDKNIAKLGNFIKCYLGFANDKNIRHDATSGGIATALSLFLLKHEKFEGVIGTRMVEDGSLDTEPVLCKNSKDLQTIMGSKYFPSAINSIFSKITLKENGKIALLGLPCHVQGIAKAAMLHPLNKLSELVTIALLCGGMKGKQATEWVFKKFKIQPETMLKIATYRGDGFPGKMIIVTKNTPEPIRIKFLDFWDDYFTSWRPWRCSLCLERTGCLADISIGDAWLPELKDETEGVSVIIARTRKGVDLIDQAARAGFIKIAQADPRTIIRSQEGLWNDIEDEVKPVYVFEKKMHKKVPHYDFENDIQVNWKKIIKARKTLLKMSVNRMMSRSQFVYNAVRFLILCKNAVRHNQCLLFFVL